MDAAEGAKSIYEQGACGSDHDRPGGTRKDGGFEQAIVPRGFGAKGPAAGVKAPIADDDKLATEGTFAIGDGDLGEGFAHGSKGGDEVGEATDFFLEGPIDEFDGAGVPAKAGHLGEEARGGLASQLKFNLRKIDNEFAGGVKDFAGGGEIGGDTEFAGEDVDRPERQDAEAHAREGIRNVADAIEDFVHRAIAAGTDDEFEAFADGFSSECAGVAGGSGRFESSMGGERIEVFSEATGFIAASGGVENDARLQRGYLNTESTKDTEKRT